MEERSRGRKGSTQILKKRPGQNALAGMVYEFKELEVGRLGSSRFMGNLNKPQHVLGKETSISSRGRTPGELQRDRGKRRIPSVTLEKRLGLEKMAGGKGGENSAKNTE